MKNSDCSAFPSKPDGFPEEFGLTKREYFAAMALQGLCAKYGSAVYKQSAASALFMADALLKELERDK